MRRVPIDDADVQRNRSESQAVDDTMFIIGKLTLRKLPPTVTQRMVR